jgi:hypothetical protein
MKTTLQTDLQKAREQLGLTDEPGADVAVLRQQLELGAHGARGPPLDVYVRFRDLKAHGIVGNWPTLIDYIENQGFPRGILLSPKVRVWSVTSIQEWINKQAEAA